MYRVSNPAEKHHKPDYCGLLVLHGHWPNWSGCKEILGTFQQDDQLNQLRPKNNLTLASLLTQTAR